MTNSKKIFLLSILALNTFCAFSQTWSDVGGGTNNIVLSFEKYNNELYVGGYFDSASGINTLGIARWNGSNWNNVGLGLYGNPFALSVYNNELFAIGNFLYAYGVSNTYQKARWNGTNWNSCSNNTQDNGSFKDMAVYNNNLYVAGNITEINGVNINRIAKWNGSTWSAVGSGIAGGIGLIQCMAVYNGQLYVGGDFSWAGGKTTYNIARWNGAAWDSVGCFGFNDVVASMVVDTVRNVLYVSGPFTMAGNTPVNHVARWNDTVWSQVGNPFNCCSYYTMVMYHNDLYGGGWSPNASVNDTVIARWDGNNWHRMHGPNNFVSKMIVYRDTLYVGGEFTLPYNYIARYYSPLTNTQEKLIDKKDYLGDCIPNPTNGVVTIPYFVPPGSKGTMIISNSEGKQINTYQLKEGNNNLEISLSSANNGIYIINLDLDNGNIKRSKKIILNR